ncbi:MAG: hypothetical protein RI894_753 [Bacteroidota bacterium]|jgi:hypothetical protein
MKKIILYFPTFLFFSFSFSVLFFTACSPRLTKETKKTAETTAKTASRTIVFPRDYIGDWEGTLMLHSPTKGQFQEVKMALKIHPLKDSAGQYTFQLIYGDGGADNRPYRLVAVDSTKNHWLVDENDGIKLDGYFIDNTFIQLFSIEGVTLTCFDRLENGVIYHEIVSAKQKPVRTSGGTSKDTPSVDSNPILSVQKAFLRRK